MRPAIYAPDMFRKQSRGTPDNNPRIAEAWTLSMYLIVNNMFLNYTSSLARAFRPARPC
jgi:hypothetical protein